MIIYSPTFTGSVQITGSQTVTGDLTVQGNLTAQTFILSSSVSYFTESFASGSTRFGDSMDDTMVVTGSLLLTGSLQVTGSSTFSSNVNINGEYLTIGGTTNNAVINNIASFRFNLDCDNNNTGESFTIGNNQTIIDNNNVLFRVQENGNVGIGTTAIYSGAKLHILGGLLAVEPTNGNTNSEILLGRGLSSLGTSAGSGITAKVNFAFEGSNDNFYQELGFVTTTANQTRINSAADFYISTKAAGASSPTEKFRITSGGSVQFKNYADFLNGSTSKFIISRAQEILGGSSDDMVLFTQAGLAIQFWTAGSKRMNISSDGYINLNDVVYGNTVNTSPRTLYIESGTGALGGISSIRKSKKNIENVSNVDWLYELNPVTFNYRKKDDEGNYTEEIHDYINYGLIAEDTAPIIDFIINYNKKEDGTEEMAGIEYPRLIIPMLKAIQDLKAEIDELKNK